ncbi:ABC transporter substrate-binding protein [Novosphingobium profundi]|uniref:ABC transporter substrate-binding protein n=1 Tax=Novosphingobium profundi TaxID=1774954 RepID=UPI001FE692AC|nr:ABC transporter substrate-binding protein [Novosphingobium profundi]
MSGVCVPFRLAPLLLALLACGCGGGDASTIAIAVVEAPALEAIPAETDTNSARLIRAATSEGLVAFDAQGRVVPALADRWIITDDGQSYIFRLRDGNWLNGDELTASSARAALMASLRAMRGSPFERDLSGIDEIRVMAGRVIEIRLQRPMPYLLQLLAQPELGLLHEKQGSGPMRRVDEWSERAEGEAGAGGEAADRAREAVAKADPVPEGGPKGQAIRLAPIEPGRLGLPDVESWDTRTRPVDMHVLSGAEAVRQFNAGTVDLVLGGRIQDFLLTRSVGILRGTIQLDPVVGLFGLHVMNDKGFLADPANREALAMAIDREALLDPFGVGGWHPSTRIVSPSLEGDLGTIGERWGEQSVPQRRDVAAGRVRAWMLRTAAQPKSDEPPARGTATGKPAAPGKPGQPPAAPLDNAPEVSVWLPEGDGSQILFARLSADLAAISVRLVRTNEAGEADLLLVDDVARYPRATWFLNRLSCAARQGLCSAEADTRVDEAAAATSPEDRAALLSEAEAELTAANVFIPFGTPIRWSLVRGSVSGFATNSWGWHPLMPLSWLPK